MKQLFNLTFLLATQCAIAQNVGIGTTTPKARLHVSDSAVLFSGGLSTNLPANPGLLPVSGGGVRMMWLPTRGAFRAGGVTTTHWNEGFIGNFSTAFGLSNRAAGQYATSVGWGNSSSGDGSFTAGTSNSAPGKYSAAFGNNTDAQAYGSVVMGRYNVLTGNTDSWVNSDPLFVVGNGYLQEVSPGIAEVVRRNAFTINKSGISTFHNDLRVEGKGRFDETVNFKDAIIVEGTGQFLKNAYVTGKLVVDTIENLKVINADYANGTMPEVNLVPLGVVDFSASYGTAPLNNTPTTKYTNLAGNLVSSVTGLYDQGQLAFDDAVVGIRLNFNAAKIADYKEIIAVGHSYFKGIGVSSNTTLSATGTYITKNLNTLKPESCTIKFEASSLPQTGIFSTSGTYMFYGLK